MYLLKTLSYLDVDECKGSLHRCNSHADCTNTAGSYLCRCKPGYFGDGLICKESECLNSNIEKVFLVVCFPDIFSQHATSLSQCRARICKETCKIFKMLTLCLKAEVRLDCLILEGKKCLYFWYYTINSVGAG